VLDLRVWIGKNKDGVWMVLFAHYMKEVASRATIHYRSSHSMSTKRNVMMNEIARIMDNCSEELPDDEWKQHVSYFVKRMQFSEYPEEFREHVVGEAIHKYEQKGTRKRSDVSSDVRTVPNKYQWYSQGGRYESVMFVEATPESELMHRVRRVVRRLKLKIKIVERAGTTVKGLLQRSNPFGIRDCGRDKCLLCSQGCGTDCRTRGCVYEYICEECRRKYRGQTSRSVYERDNEHIELWEKGDDECPLQRHANMYHNGGHFVAELRVLARCFGKPSRRLITEAVMIDELDDEMTMNGKSEWSYVKLAKVGMYGQSK
jgi:predicted small metal-binding protein